MDNRLKELQETKTKLEGKLSKAPDSEDLLKQGKITYEQYLHNQELLDNLKNKLERIEKEIEIIGYKSDVKLKTNDKMLFRENKYKQAEMEGLGMEWYKWNIYFRLFTVIIFALKSILEAVNLDVTNNLYLGIVIVINIGMIIWTLFTRYWLYRFKYKGIINYFVVVYGAPVVLCLIPLLIGNMSFSTSYFSTLLAYVIILFPELKYWRKRAHLFDRDNKKTSSEYLKSELPKSDNANFIRNCKAKLGKTTRMGSILKNFIKDKRLLSFSAILLLTIAISLFFTFKNLNLKAEYNDLSFQYKQLQSEYNDFKENSIKEQKNSYNLGFEDGYNKCHSEFKEMTPAERNDFFNNGY